MDFFQARVQAYRRRRDPLSRDQDRLGLWAGRLRAAMSKRRRCCRRLSYTRAASSVASVLLRGRTAGLLGPFSMNRRSAARGTGRAIRPQDHLGPAVLARIEVPVGLGGFLERKL